MTYKVIDIFKDLPRRQACDGCGRPGCFAFATAVHLEGALLTRCPHLSSGQLESMNQKIAESRLVGGGPREAPEAQAAKALRAELATRDLAQVATRAGVELRPSPTPSVTVELFGRTFDVASEDVRARDGGEIEVWTEVVLLMYLTRASGESPSGQWVAFRELPNTISKQKTFEKWIDRLVEWWSGRFDELIRRAADLGGVEVEADSADRGVQFQALPRVPLLLMLWEGDEDFPARGSLLLDRDVLGYLDQEALTFVAEDLMRRLTPA